MSIRPSHASATLVFSVALAGALALASGCTLTADEFDPLLVSRADAGPLPAIVADAAPPATAVASDDECAREAQASCSASIGLLEPRAVDAGQEPVAAPASLMLPPCQNGFDDFGAPEPLAGIDFGDDVYGPALSSDGRTLYFSAYVDGEQQIYAATRAERTAAFDGVSELRVINSPAMDGSPFISQDGQRLYFFSEREEGAIGRRDIWVSEREGDEFKAPSLVLGINTPSTELLPWLTADERTVLFISGRQGGRGGADVWRASRRDAGEAFGAPTNVADLSSSGNEGRAVLSSDGTSAFFSSDRGGNADIWTASRQSAGAAFSEPRRLDAVSSGATELDVSLSSDDRELLFASTRSGRSALYRAERGCR